MRKASLSTSSYVILGLLAQRGRQRRTISCGGSTNRSAFSGLFTLAALRGARPPRPTRVSFGAPRGLWSTSPRLRAHGKRPQRPAGVASASDARARRVAGSRLTQALLHVARNGGRSRRARGRSRRDASERLDEYERIAREHTGDARSAFPMATLQVGLMYETSQPGLLGEPQRPPAGRGVIDERALPDPLEGFVRRSYGNERYAVATWFLGRLRCDARCSGRCERRVGGGVAVRLRSGRDASGAAGSPPPSLRRAARGGWCGHRPDASCAGRLRSHAQ